MFGELICGPPGSGKTTYCEGKRQFLSVYDPMRPVAMLNLDPANEDVFPYPCDVDVRELVHHDVVMRSEALGPNGTYLFCADVIEQNLDWIIEKVEETVERRMGEVLATASPADQQRIRAPYLIIDCPGQVEFYLHSQLMPALVRALEKRLQCSLCAVHLVDAGVATRDISTYVSSCLLSISTMVDNELPHVNVMSKWDTLPAEMAGNEELEDGGANVFLMASSFLTENFDRLWMRQLRRRQRERRQAQYHVTADHPVPVLDSADRAEDAALERIDLRRDGGRLYAYTRAMMEVIDGYGLVGYVPLDVQSQDMMLRLTQEIDNAVGNFV